MFQKHIFDIAKNNKLERSSLEYDALYMVDGIGSNSGKGFFDYVRKLTAGSEKGVKVSNAYKGYK